MGLVLRERLRDWARRVLGSALSCCVGFHRACDGIAAGRYGPDTLCTCRCHWCPR